MTNLTRWLTYINLFAIPYMAIVFGVVQSDFLSDQMFLIQILPIILIGLFGLYAVATVLYRVFTFNDCPEAAEELQRQIKEARIDLIAKGFKFRD